MSESIYNLIPQQEQKAYKPRRYKSRHDPNQMPTASTFTGTNNTSLVGANVGASQASMRRTKGKTAQLGKPLGQSKPNPTQYMKKRTQESGNQDIKPYVRPVQSRKAAVPKQDEAPVMGLQSTKNYVTANAVEAILAVPGHRAAVKPQQPQYRNKVDYGKVPSYLKDVKDEISRENQMIQNYLQQQEAGGQDDYDGQGGEALGQEEIEQLVDALKTKWDTVNAKYQKMCHMVKLDTHGKVRRKEQMESELKQLEQDIEKLEGREVVVEDY